MLLFRLSGSFLLRFDERRLSGLLFVALEERAFGTTNRREPRGTTGPFRLRACERDITISETEAIRVLRNLDASVRVPESSAAWFHPPKKMRSAFGGLD